MSAPSIAVAQSESSDITLLLEGTYPYVSGGVSSWVHELITGLPELRFSVVFLGSDPKHYGPARYELPKNLVHLETHYLMQAEPLPAPRARVGHREAFAEMEWLHDAFRSRAPLPEGVVNGALSHFGGPSGITAADFFHSEAAWEQIQVGYEERSTDPSFVDYFWTVRGMHAPLFKLAEIADSFPPTRVLHAVSTGYAGFLGALAARRRHFPFVLTEHGIYTKERRIDLANATWIKDGDGQGAPGSSTDLGYLRGLWVRFFEGIGRLAYASADPILTLFEGNRLRQIADGAEADRTRIIPNGIDIGRFAGLALDRTASDAPPVVGLVGRIVPIKDIRTFIRAMRIVCTRYDTAEGWIAGPEDEDPVYARECRDLVATLGLSDRVKFLGYQKAEDLFPRLTVTMLTSISEALPLVVLESFASGVPVVATDVGACRELILGRDADDCALGAAGKVIPIGDPQAAADAALALLSDPTAQAAAARAGQARVRRHYGRDQMYQQYRAIYGQALERSRGGHRVSAS